MTREHYPSDLTDKQWQIVRPPIPKRAKVGRRPIDRREILDAILYVNRTGCQWRALPHDFPNWKTVYGAAEKKLGTEVGDCPDSRAAKMGLSASEIGKLFLGRPDTVFWRWPRDGVWKKIHDALWRKVRAPLVTSDDGQCATND